MLIRPAAAPDALQIAAIYAHYVRETAVTFATREPTAQAYAARIGEGQYPFFVAEEAGMVAGFAYAASFREKEAFRWDAELTVYLAPGFEGHGIGKALLSRCLEALRAMGCLNAYSCITLPNERSVGLHRGMGFRELGVFRNTGYKLGEWCDVVWMGLELGDFSGEPEEVRPFRSLLADASRPDITEGGNME